MVTEQRKTLTEVLADSQGRHELHTPHYNQIGDCLAIHFEDVEYYGDRIDDVLTVYRSIESSEIVGCKIKGVSLLVENVANIFHIEDGDIELRLLFLNAMGTKKARKHYYDLSERCGTIQLHVAGILPKAA